MSMHDKDGKTLYDHMGQLTDAGIQHFVDAGKGKPDSGAPGGDVEQRSLCERLETIAHFTEVTLPEIHSTQGHNPTVITYVPESIREAIAALSAPKQVGGSDIYEAYKSWPADIRKKLSLQDLRRMSGWAPRTAVSDWRIDTSAGGPILVYQNCSVIEGEQARYVLGLIEKDSAPQPVEAEHDDWYTDPDTGTHVLDLDDNPNRQLSIMLKSDGRAVFSAYLDGEKIVGAVSEDFRDAVLKWAAPQAIESEGWEVKGEWRINRSTDSVECWSGGKWISWGTISEFEEADER